MKQGWSLPLEIEYRMADIQAQQELRGVAFDVDAASDLFEKIYFEIEEIDKVLLAELPMQVIKGTEYKKVFNLDGSYKKFITEYMGDNIDQVGGRFCQVKYEPFNLDSSGQVKSYLLSHGWVPTQYNTKKEGRRNVRTSPKLTEDSFASVGGSIPALVTKRSALVSRKRLLFNVRKKDSRLTGLINLVRSDGRISAEGIPQATNTGRFRHKNVVNIPAERAVYGKEVRSLFVPGDGYVLVGSDAAALEARIEAHYCYKFPGGEQYAHELIDGDVHAKNAKWFDTDRDGAKSPKYLLSYGGAAARLSETLGCSLQRAEEIYNAFWSNNTALAGFRDAIAQQWESRGGKSGGYLIGLDGRKIFIRSPHSAVNLTFQSGGSIIVKYATILLNQWVKKHGIDAHQVIHYHDEFQFEVKEKYISQFRELSEKSFVKAGERFNLNVPIKGTTQVGMSWAETH